MSFIVIEGLDGAGKSTQIKYLSKYLDNKNVKNEYIHFPTNKSPVYGDLIARFLRGELGSLKQVNPYLVALLFAGDRYNMKECINAWIDDGKVVVNDRYVYSNIGFQCAKTNSEQEAEELFNWILDIEYNYFKIPKPNLSIFLDVPFEFTKQKLTENRRGKSRDYLKGKSDIHEEDFDFQMKVKQSYDKALNKDENFIKIICYENNKMLTPKIISEKIIKELNDRTLI